MTEIQVGLTGLGALLVLLSLRIPVGVALIGVSFVGIWSLVGERVALSILTSTPYAFTAHWTLSSVPMFLLMGYFCYHAGLTKNLFDAARVWLAKLPGGLAVASIFGAAGFAAVTGSSVACAAAMGRIAVPEMMRNRYDASLATGTVAAAGTIGALIPPSILMILYGIFVEVPISQLFLGGVSAGILTAAGYVAVVVIRAKLNPKLAPAYEGEATFGEKMKALRDTWPLLLILFGVFGGLFSGAFTATEAGGIGALLSFLVAGLKGQLTWQSIKNAVIETLVTTASLLIIAVGAALLTRFLALSGTTQFLSSVVLGFGADPVVILIMIAIMYLAIGMFLEPIGAMLLTLPVIMPIMMGLDYSLIWFGVVLTKFLEIGMITPPIGINVFVIKGVVGDLASTTTIFKGIMWFLAADIVVVALLMIFPDIILYLPSLMQD